MKRKYVYLYLLGLLLFSVACTGNFRDYNTDLSGITDDDLIIDDNGYGIRLGIIQQGIYFNYDYGKGKNWPFQLIQNLNADMFSGYMHDGKPLNGARITPIIICRTAGIALCGHTCILIFSHRYISRRMLPEIHILLCSG